MNQRPDSLLGLHHIALFVKDLEAALHFYVDLLGMRIEWQPDADNIYLTSGTDNLALHRTQENYQASQRLDHIGFIIAEMSEVDRWYEFLKAEGIVIKNLPKTHRDGARSFYCLDPEGVAVQMIYHPPLSKRTV